LSSLHPGTIDWIWRKRSELLPAIQASY